MVKRVYIYPKWGSIYFLGKGDRIYQHPMTKNETIIDLSTIEKSQDTTMVDRSLISIPEQIAMYKIQEILRRGSLI